jgi:ferredoxin-NADP reductase/Na+-translocating ferredoxin:NAD+ oxidoreductase RnfD subunit
MLSKPLLLLDRLLNSVTMYRLVIYYLLALLGIACVQNYRGAISYPWLALVVTPTITVGVSCLVNWVFANVFDAPLNHDSAVITGLILSLIVGPAIVSGDYFFLFWAATLAMASKYIIAIHNMHLFNPAAIAVVITWLATGSTASWWIGTASMTPFVIAGGLVLIRKIRRTDVVFSFLWAALFISMAWSALDGNTFTHALSTGVFDSPIWFMAFVMMTEPITMPPTQLRQTVYGVIAGFLVVPQLHLGSFYLSPEVALVVANAIFIPFRSISRQTLFLDRALALGPGLMDFIYTPARRLAYSPGQYMEWTLDHDRIDDRGTRRYFTLASSPTERNVRIGVKFSQDGSSFKDAMLANVHPGAQVVASQVTGDFTLPDDPRQKLAFIAGGIGITPFRSMVKYLLDRGERRDIVLIYANRTPREFVYGDVFMAAQKVFRLRPVLVASDASSVPANWPGFTGHIDVALIQRQVPDYSERLFYVSGPPSMVRQVHDCLRDLRVKKDRIKTDYFSGL